MIRYTLKAKHWQIFLLTFGIPFLTQAIVIGLTVSDLFSGKNINPEQMLGYFKFFPIIMFLFIFFYWEWLYAMAIGLQKYIPSELRLKTVWFKLFFFFPLAYIIFFMWFFLSLISNGFQPIGFFAIILPLHIFSMFCIIYCLYFVAKTLKMAELKRAVTFNDFIAEFFMIWFYPVGVWIIQPKINKIILEPNAVENSETINNSL